MEKFGELIRSLREKEGYPLRKVAAFLDIDQAILSKIERGQRKPNRKQVLKLAEFFNYDKKELLVSYLSDRIIYEIGDDEYAKEALKVAEQKLEYRKTQIPDRKETVKKIANKLSQFSKIGRAWVFGSFARNEEDFNSDIDLMIEVPDRTNFSLFDLADIQYQLEDIIRRKIDVVMKNAVKPEIMERIKPDLTLIYER